MASWPAWDAIETAVKRADYTGGEFNQIKTKVLQASPDDLESVAPAQKKLVWQFLVGMGEKRSLFRNQIIQVVKRLVEVPSWVDAWQASPDLHAKAETLHSDLKAALNTIGGGDRPVPTHSGIKLPNQLDCLLPSSFREGGGASSGDLAPSPGAPWPEWAAIRKAVEEGRIIKASEEFNEIQIPILRASVEDLEGQSAQAELMWTFLVEFAGGRSIYKSRVLQTINKLMEAPSWLATFVMSEDLKAKARSLPEQFHFALNLDVEASNAKLPISRKASFEERLQAAMSPVDELPTNAPSRGSGYSTSAADAIALLPVLPTSTDEDDTPVAFASSRSIGGDEVARSTSSKKDFEDKTIVLSTLVVTAQKYINQADAFDATTAVAAYFCRRWALELLIPARSKGVHSAESDAILFSTLKRVEHDQHNLPGTEQERKDLMEGFANHVFDQASNLERASSVAGIAVPYFYLAGLLLDSLAQFYNGKLPAHLEEKVVSAHLRGTTYTGGAVSVGALPPYPPGSQVAAVPAAAPAPAVAPAATPSAPRAAAPPPAVAPAPVAAAPAAAPAARARTSGKNISAAQKLLPKVEAKVEIGDLPSARAMILDALALLDGP